MLKKILPTPHPPNNKNLVPLEDVGDISILLNSTYTVALLLVPQRPWATCAADYSSLNLPWPFPFIQEVFNYLGFTSCTSGEPPLMASLPSYTKKESVMITEQTEKSSFLSAPAGLKLAKWSQAPNTLWAPRPRLLKTLFIPSHGEAFVLTWQYFKLWNCVSMCI